MPTKEHDLGGNLYMLIDGEYQKVGPMKNYEVSASTDLTRIIPRKYPYYVRIKLLLWSIRTWLKWKLRIDRYTIEWVKLDPNRTIATTSHYTTQM